MNYDGNITYYCNINGINIIALDSPNSVALKFVADELMINHYGLFQIQLHPGQVVIDIGGHSGLVSMYLAKRFPETKIYTFEPFPANYKRLTTALALNQIENVIPHSIAVTKDGRDIQMAMHPINSGGATAMSETQKQFGVVENIPSITLDEIFDRYKIDNCQLLKIDCEGTEYEILYHTTVLSRIEYLAGEFHNNTLLREQGYTIEGLVEYCQQFFPPNRIFVNPSDMSE